MPNFDPIDLGIYFPSRMVTIRQVAESVLSAFVKAQYAYMSDTLKNEDLSNEERKFFELRMQHNSNLYDSYEMQQWSWSIVRDRLIREQLEAFAIDEKREIHPLNRDFWISEYGNVALSTGIILPIPLFTPKGEVIVSQKALHELYREFYDGVYEGYSPLNFEIIPSIAEAIPVLEDNAEIISERRGAKAKYDLELFLHEAFALIYDANPMPRTQADLGRRAAEAYEAKSGKGGRPSDPWVRATVAKLWRRLDLSQDQQE